MGLIKKIMVAVVIYAAFMLVLMPAKVVLALAPLPSQLQVSQVTGTIWQGQSELVKVGPRRLEQVSWSIRPMALFTGTLELDVMIGNRSTPVSGKAKLMLSPAGAQVEQLQFDAPHGFLLANTRLPFRTKTQGDISLVIPEGSQGKPWCETLSGKLFMNQTQVTNQFGEYPIGNVEFGLSCDNGQIKLTTDETKNSIDLAGDIIVGERNRLQVMAKIKPTDSQPDDLRNALGFLGQPDAEGYYPLRYNGVIPRL